MARLIAMCGPDKMGKETQSKMLVSSLRELGYRVELAEVPVKDAITHRLIYWMLRRGLAKKLPNVFQFVQFLNRIVFQTFKLKELLAENDFVILDRWALSAIVYGDATGVNKRFNRFLFKMMKRPHLTIVLTGEKKSKRVDDVYEADSLLQARVSAGYWNWVDAHPVDHELVSNHGEREDVHHRIMCVLMHDDIVLGGVV